VGYAVAGSLTGVLAKFADVVPGGEVSAIASGLAVWTLLLAVIARVSPGPGWAALRATVFFLAMVAAYYAVTLLVLRDLVTPRLVVAWGAAAVTACPLLAAVLQRSFRSRRIVAAVPIGVVTGAMFIDGATRRVLIALQEPDLAAASRPLAAGVEVLAAIVIAILLPRIGRVRLLGAGIAIITTLLLLPLIERLVYGFGLFA
jgi:hypothetical protein